MRWRVLELLILVVKLHNSAQIGLHVTFDVYGNW